MTVLFQSRNVCVFWVSAYNIKPLYWEKMSVKSLGVDNGEAGNVSIMLGEEKEAESPDLTST